VTPTRRTRALPVQPIGPLLLALGALALLPTAGRADGFSTSNVQVLQGWRFHDNLLGYDTRSGTMTTVTLENFVGWAYGDSFAFVDLYRGDFVNGNTRTGSTADVYVEWHPRLFLDQVFGLGALGPIRHWGLAAEVNQSRDFSAYLAGLGVDLEIPGFAVAGVNLYYRYSAATVRFATGDTLDSVNLYHHTWQLSPFWTVPFHLGPVGFLFTGFADYFADPHRKFDLMAQPQLLLDLGEQLPGVGPGRLHLGSEWYLHVFRNPDPTRGGTMKVVSLPQAMIRWTLH
jgi:nucleoside-specific outer membrane channel protein Tsx